MDTLPSKQNQGSGSNEEGDNDFGDQLQGLPVIHSLMSGSDAVPFLNDLTTPCGTVFLSTELSQVLFLYVISFELFIVLYYKLF